MEEKASSTMMPASRATDAIIMTAGTAVTARIIATI
jgi:hypothetical protein